MFHPPPHDDFNDSKLVMPPKGKEVGDASGNIVRPPKKTRPISLSNTDAKHVASLAAIPLNHVAQQCVSQIQKGGISGRKFAQHIIDLEAKLIHYILTRNILAGIFGLDQEAAFPSVSRKYVFWVLKMMGVPKDFLTFSQLGKVG